MRNGVGSLSSPDGPLGSSMLGTEIMAFAKCLLSLSGLLSQKVHLGGYLRQNMNSCIVVSAFRDAVARF